MTAIFITDEMFEATNRLAHKMGLSLNELYANAIREYLNSHKDENLIAQINAVCDQVDTIVFKIMFFRKGGSCTRPTFGRVQDPPLHQWKIFF